MSQWQRLLSRFYWIIFLSRLGKCKFMRDIQICKIWICWYMIWCLLIRSKGVRADSLCLIQKLCILDHLVIVIQCTKMCVSWFLPIGNCKQKWRVKSTSGNLIWPNQETNPSNAESDAINRGRTGSMWTWHMGERRGSISECLIFIDWRREWRRLLMLITMWSRLRKILNIRVILRIKRRKGRKNWSKNRKSRRKTLTKDNFRFASLVGRRIHSNSTSLQTIKMSQLSLKLNNLSKINSSKETLLKRSKR